MAEASSERARIGLANRLRPAVPVSDDRDEASAVLNEVLWRTDALHYELRVISNRHLDQAPASCEHVSELTARLSRTILDWIEEWPS